MMNNPDFNALWRDTLDEGIDHAFAEQSRVQTLTGVRRLRRRRKLLRAGFACAGGCALFYLAARLAAPSPALVVAASTPQPIRKTSEDTSLLKVRFLTDEELLSRFPHRPIALIGPPEHRQLVFLDDPEIHCGPR